MRPKNRMVCIVRRYRPKANLPRMATSRTSQFSPAGRLIGSGIGTRGRLGRTLTKRTMSGPEGSLANGSAGASCSTSLAEQTITSVSKGSRRRNSWRSAGCLMGFQTTKVPAAPTFVTPSSAISLASQLGRKVRCPPTLTPFKKTTEAIESFEFSRPRDVLVNIISREDIQAISEDALKPRSFQLPCNARWVGSTSKEWLDISAPLRDGSRGARRFLDAPLYRATIFRRPSPRRGAGRCWLNLRSAGCAGTVLRGRGTHRCNLTAMRVPGCRAGRLPGPRSLHPAKPQP
jgi:hypothetical protein